MTCLNSSKMVKKSFFKGVVYFTLKNHNAAKRVVDSLIKTPNDSIILPFADYPGPIAEEILSRDFGLLTVCERDESTRNRFQAHIKEKFPEREIRVYSDDIFDLSFKTGNHEAQKRCSTIVKEHLDKAEKTLSDRTIKLLVPLLRSRYESGFLKNIYYQMSIKQGLCSNTLVHYYFLMSDRQYHYLDAKPNENLFRYRPATILYNTIFNIHKLDSFDLETCFKIKLNKIQSTAEGKKPSYQQVHSVWLEPRHDIIKSLSSRSLVEYRFLVYQLMHKRKTAVVPAIEKWFKNCYEDIAPLGITQQTRAGDLDKDQFYNLFKYLRNRPDYRDSLFIQAATCAEENLLTL